MCIPPLLLYHQMNILLIFISACDHSVQNSIINAKPNFLNLPESTAIDTIESLVTKRSNPMVHCMTFNSIKQGDAENMQDFVIRLQAVVPDCEFTCPDCQYDLSDINIRDQLIRGLNNILQTDILTKASQLKTLEDVAKHSKPVEAAIRDQSHLENRNIVHDTAYGAHQSTYQRQKSYNHLRQHNRQKPCMGCGSTQHNQFERSTKCQAWGQECKNCGILNHYARVCLRHNDRSKVNSINLVAHVKYITTLDTYTPTSSSFV